MGKGFPAQNITAYPSCKGVWFMHDGGFAKVVSQKVLARFVFVKLVKTNLIFRKEENNYFEMLLPLIWVKIVK